jgi:hypothetical protein
VAQSEPGLEGQYFVHLDMTDDGTIIDLRPGSTEMSPVQSEALTACLRTFFVNHQLPAKGRASKLGVEFRIRPFEADAT